jgi:LysM repeat protein
MNSIRPLLTITILVVAGVFLYVKINEGPVKSGVANDAWQNLPSDGVPPLNSTAPPSAAASGGMAPAWPAATAATTPAPMPVASATPPVAATASEVPSDSTSSSGNGPEKLPAVPEIPKLPDAPKMAETAAPAQSSISPPVGLPENIPTARYPDQPAATTASTTPSPTTESPTKPDSEIAASSLNPSLPSSAPASEPPLVPVVPAPPLSNPLEVAASNAAIPSPETEPVNPLRQPPAQPQPLAQPDRYAIDTPPSTQPAAETTPIAPAPATSTFAATWPAIQAALDRRELARAHQLLSPFHNDPALTPAESQQVENLLGQLAGTVVYSTEHQLGPAHVVKNGETLETIANECNVPWQLLAKINGVSAADQVRPGQELKVVKGPFAAVLDPRRNELSLTVDGRYAGKFSVNTQPGVELPAGEWIVSSKLASESSTAQTSSTIPVSYATAIKQLVLQSASPTAGQPATPVVIGSEPAIAGPATSGAPPQAPQYFVKVSQSDVEEIADILSVGSHVVIRR